MTDEDKTAEGTTESQNEENEENEERPGNPEGEDKRPDDTLADEKKCPECGAPVDDVRATCINCGYEYSAEDHEDDEAGNEFMAGTQVDDRGNEIPQDPHEDDQSQDSDDSESSDDSDSSGDSSDSDSSDGSDAGDGEDEAKS